MTENQNPIVKKYTKTGIIATVVVVIAVIAGIIIAKPTRSVDTSAALSEVSTNAAMASDLKIAVISMDKIQLESKALKDLHKQRASFEDKLKTRLEKEQKALEKLIKQSQRFVILKNRPIPTR